MPRDAKEPEFPPDIDGYQTSDGKWDAQLRVCHENADKRTAILGLLSELSDILARARRAGWEF